MIEVTVLIGEEAQLSHSNDTSKGMALSLIFYSGDNDDEIIFGIRESELELAVGLFEEAAATCRRSIQSLRELRR